MTLAQWAETTGVWVGVYSDNQRWIPISLVRQSDLWDMCHLDDYAVTANSGGSYWLVRKG